MKYFLMLLSLITIFPGFSQEINNGNLKVIGKSKRLLVPDRITFSFHFNVKDKTLAGAQNNLVIETNRLVDRMQKSGYSRNDVKLLSMNVQEEMDWTGDKYKKIGYLAESKIELSIAYDPLKISEFIDSLKISSFKFLEYDLNLEISERLKNSTREYLITNAIENAKKSADIIARSSNTILCGISSIEYKDLLFNVASNDDFPPPPPPPMMLEVDRTASSMRFDKVALAEMEVYEEVIIIWKIKDIQ